MSPHAAALTADRPRLRGVLHRYACLVSLVLGAILVARAPEGSALPLAIYVGSVVGLFGTSALYHGVVWSPRAYRWMRRVDHSMIFVLMTGSFTPIALLALDSPQSRMVYWLFCAASAFGILLKLLWISAPKWVSACTYVAVGWIGVAALPDLWTTVGPIATGLILMSGVIYTVGALVYALRRPNPLPEIFGYHEVFHALVILAAALHFGTVAVWLT